MVNQDASKKTATRSPKRIATLVSAVILGAVVVLLGIAFVGMYITSAIVDRIGDPDQSLLFWYLPVLFIGLVGATVGLLLLLWGLKQLRAPGSTEGRSGRRHSPARDGSRVGPED